MVEIPTHVWIAAGAAFGVTLAATPAVRRIAIARDIYDRPDSGLKPHQRPIPYLGGLAMFAGWLVAMGIARYYMPSAQRGLYAIGAAGTLLMLVGLIDDLRDLRPFTKLALQVAAAAILLVGGIGRTIVERLVEALAGPVAPDSALATVCVGASGAMVFLIIAGATNATNLIDGLDGLCAGVTAISGAGYAVLALGASRLGMPSDPAALILAAALTGVCLGFLPYNFNPASIFMGDSGSLLLGFNAAALIVLLTEVSGPNLFLASLAVFGFPILDAALAITRRKLNGKPLFVGDRSHFYDQLRDRGWSVRRTAVTCYVIGGVCAALGAAGLFLRLRMLTILYLSVGVFTAIVLVRLRMLRVDDAAARSGLRSGSI